MIENIVNYTASIPMWIWITLSVITGIIVGGLIQKRSNQKTSGTLWVIQYGNGVEDYYLEMHKDIPPSSVKEYSRLTFDVKLRRKE